MSTLPLQGILGLLILGGAIGTSISTFPTLFKKTKPPRLVLATSKNGKELYIKLEDLKQQPSHHLAKSRLKDCEESHNNYCPYVLTCLQETSQDCEEDLESSISVDLYLDEKKLFLSSNRVSGKHHSLESPKGDNKFYLLEEGGNKKFFGGREITDTRNLQQYISDSTDYLEFKGDWWKQDNHKSLEKITDCAYFKDENHSDSTTIICSPHPIANGWGLSKSQVIIKEFNKGEIVY